MLRILCILGIVTLHTFGAINNSSTSCDLLFSTAVVSGVFNCGVTIFALISGYFQVSFTIKKIVRLELTVIIYTLISTLISCAIVGGLDIKNIIKAFMPISMGRYWYMTTYMLLLIFSKYINAAPEKLNKKEFSNLIILLFIVFSLAPSILQSHVMGDGGKGFANILLAYYIGRYIRIYKPEKSVKQYSIIGLISLVICIGLNYLISLLKGGTELYAPFSRDCSVFILIASVCIFCLFLKLNVQSIFVNHLASHVIGVYLFEGAVRMILGSVFDLTSYANHKLFLIITLLYVILVGLICAISDCILNPLIGNLTSFLTAVIEKMSPKFYLLKRF